MTSAFPLQDRIEATDNAAATVEGDSETVKVSSKPQRESKDAGEARSGTESATPLADYTSFRKTQRIGIMIMVGMAGFLSPLSAMIYFPSLTYIGEELGISLRLMNLTITTYLIVQGVVPSVLGEVADQLGRRPVYLSVLAIYFLANVGLALQHSYAALLVLRMVQSAGSSGTIALGFSVVSDIAPPHIRGRYVGASLYGPNVGPSLGPVLGGVIADTAGWRWTFWLLAILGGLCLLFFFVFFPETARVLVGNGSLQAKGINKPLIFLVSPPNITASERKSMHRAKLTRVPNPLSCLRVIFHKDVGLVLFGNAIYYMNYQCVQASLSPLLMDIYRLNALEVGFCYLAYGVASGVATYLAGRIIDHDYRVTATAAGFTVDKRKGDDLTNFPIEKARLRSIFYFMAVSTASTLGYGWAMRSKTHLSVPLIMQFLCGLATTGTFNVCATLIIDLYPAAPATASASISLVRCLLAAAGISVLEPLIDAIGVGWTFTALAAFCSSAVPMMYIERRWGMAWRQARLAREPTSSVKPES